MSRQLAIEGGPPLVRRPIRALQSIRREECWAVANFMRAATKGKATLSGYLAGSERGGPAVQRLEEVWCEEFGCRYAVACNSATSALFAAQVVLNGSTSNVIPMPTLAMSAIASTAVMAGQKIKFLDLDEVANTLGPTNVIVNLFGHPAPRPISSGNIIEDNAQAPWAVRPNSGYTGTKTAIGVWSMNVHKPINAGEGGMLTTNRPELADLLRRFINHGEMSGRHDEVAGLNLRMTELTAVIVLSQLPHAKAVVQRRQDVARLLGGEVEGSAWHCFPISVNPKRRAWAANALRAEGVPVREGYTLIHQLPAFKRFREFLPRAEAYEAGLLLIELCAIDPSDQQCEQMRKAIEQVTQCAN